MPTRTRVAALTICLSSFSAWWLATRALNSEPLGIAAVVPAIVTVFWVWGSYGWREYVWFGLVLGSATLLLAGLGWAISRPFA